MKDCPHCGSRLSVDEDGYCNAGCGLTRALWQWYQRLAAAQVPLDPVAARVLRDHAFELYDS